MRWTSISSPPRHGSTLRPPLPDAGERKAALRGEARSRRAAAAEPAGGHVSAALAANFFAALSLDASAVVAGYQPINDEIDPGPLMTELEARGHALALPAIAPRENAPGGDELVFRIWRTRDPLGPGPFGTRQPDASAAPVRPGVVLVPLLAFDGAGHRLGYGKGYYDRALAALRGIGLEAAMGLAEEAAEGEVCVAANDNAPGQVVLSGSRAAVVAGALQEIARPNRYPVGKAEAGRKVLIAPSRHLVPGDLFRNCDLASGELGFPSVDRPCGQWP